MKNFTTKTLALLTAGLTALSCADDGENGLGFDERTEFGGVEINLNGTLPNREDFNTSTSLPIASVSTVDVDLTEEEEENIHTFTIGYESVGPFSSATIVLSVTDIGGNDEEINSFSLTVGGIQILIEDNQPFVINDSFNFIKDSNILDVDDVDIDNLVFDKATGKLSFSFKFDLDDDQNTTDNDLDVSGTVDVTIFEIVKPDPDEE